MSKSQSLALFYEDVRVTLDKMGTAQVCQAPRSGTVMALYCQKNDLLYHMFRRILVDNKVSIRYSNRASYIPKILESCPLKPPLAQAVLLPSGFDIHLFFHSLIFLEDCMQTHFVLHVITIVVCASSMPCRYWCWFGGHSLRPLDYIAYKLRCSDIYSSTTVQWYSSLLLVVKEGRPFISSKFV